MTAECPVCHGSRLTPCPCGYMDERCQYRAWRHRLCNYCQGEGVVDAAGALDLDNDPEGLEEP